MGEIFLVIVFSVSGGPYIFDDDWGPRIQPSYEVCAERADRVIEYIEEQTDLPPLYGVICGTTSEVREFLSE